MLKFFSHKRGDTLIEVTLAIGVFSLVAVAAVSVLSTSTSGAEDTLETSITREQIDAQADALRFIQNAAFVDHDTATPKFSILWDKIKANAITINTSNPNWAEELLQYTPDSCAENYSDTIVHNDATVNNDAYNKAFIIDPNQLSNYANANLRDANEMLKNVYIDKNSKNSSARPILTQTSTYPRLVYSDASDTQLIDSDVGNNLASAEGIYVVAVKDSRDSTADYYDFYIRTCWYGTDDSERPSAISTVIRLNDLDATKYEIPEGTLSYGAEKETNNEINGKVTGNYPSGTIQAVGSKVTVTATPRCGFLFQGWYDEKGERVSKDNPYTYTITHTNQSITAKFGIEINVLNVYPDREDSNSLASWMNQWGINRYEGNTRLKVTPVKITDFNTKPYSYLGSNGNWNYDIVVFGFWDVNNSKDLNSSSAAALRNYLTNGGKVLFGHDTFHSGNCYTHTYFKSLEDLAGLECDNFGWTATDKVKIIKSGVFTEYPYQIGGVGTILTIPPAHRTQFKTKGIVWLRFDNLPDKADNTNFYLASYGNTAYINTGHSNGKATDDERKIIANVLFYLHSLNNQDDGIGCTNDL